MPTASIWSNWSWPSKRPSTSPWTRPNSMASKPSARQYQPRQRGRCVPMGYFYTKNLDDGRRVGKHKQHGLSFLPAVTIGQLLTEETQLPQRPSQCHRSEERLDGK